MNDILKWRGNPRAGSGDMNCVAYNEHQRANTPDATGWARALRDILSGWQAYADTYSLKYGSVVGSDGVLGPAWLQIAQGIRRLLDGDTGGLDAGSINANIRDFLTQNGIDTTNL